MKGSLHYLNHHLIIFVLAGAALLTLPWLGSKPFHTKGEPREAITAQAMLASGNWILPQRYGNDIATKPPLLHWLIGTFSLGKGEVTEATSRLPSALGYLLGGMAFFLFVRRNESDAKALVATFFLLTTLQWSHGAMAARVDMLLTGCMVWAFTALYRWEEKQLKGIPWFAVLAMSMATLTKGPVGVVLPCMVLFFYLLLRGYRLAQLFRAMLLAGLPSVVLPALWYLAAWQTGGDQFLAIVYDENIARFTGTMKLGGEHRNSNLFLLGTLISGMMPWSLPALMAGVKALFALKKPAPGILKRCTTGVQQLAKHKQFSAVAIASILLFYAIPASKRAAYLMPAYPFISLFLADLFFRLVGQKSKIWVLFEKMTGGLMILSVLMITMFTLGWNPSLSLLPEKEAAVAAFYVEMMHNLYVGATLPNILVTLLFVSALTLWTLQRKNAETLIPRAPFLTALFAFLLFLNAFLQPQVGKHLSVQSFAEKIKQQELPGTTYYTYGRSCFVMSFYLNHRFLEFPDTEAERGILIIGEKELEKLRTNTGNMYQFSLIDKSPHPYTDIRQTQCRVAFQKISQPLHPEEQP